MFRWRQPREGELDHELLWLAVTVFAALGTAVWLQLELPWPHCAFREVTGHRCLSCGATTCFLALWRGEFSAALGANPGALGVFGSVAVFDLYAAVVLAFRLPRVRWEMGDPKTPRRLRFATITLLGLNWFYEWTR